MNPALQKADTLSAAPKVLLVFVGDVLQHVWKTREAGIALGYRFLLLSLFFRA